MDYDYFLTRNGQLEFWTEQKNSFKNVKIIGNQIILKLDFAQFFVHSFCFSNNVRRKQGKSWGWTWLTLASISNKEVVRSQRINLNLIFLSMAKSCELYGNTGWDVFKWGIQNHKEFGLFYLWLCWILCPVFLVIKNPIDKLCLHQILVNCLPQ